MKIDVLRKNLIIQYIKDGVWYGTEDHIVWSSIDHGATWRKVCQLQPNGQSVLAIVKDKLLRNGIVRNYRKNIGIHNVVVLESGTIIAQYDKIYRFSGSDKFAEPIYDLIKEGVAGPLKNGLCYDRSTDNIFFGEYIIERPASVRIVRGRDDGRCWDVCYQFSKGQVRHIHGIFSDPYRSRIWVCTGDNDKECGLYYSDDGFETVHKYGGGDQSWRMVSLLITKDSLIWGSDAGQDAPRRIKNYIYKLDVASGKRQKICCIDKPAYYSTFLADGSMCIATTFEPKIKRQVSASADLWWSKDGEEWSLIYSFPYKCAGRQYGTKYASIFVPDNSSSKKVVFCSLVNVENFDFMAVRIPVPR